MCQCCIWWGLEIQWWQDPHGFCPWDLQYYNKQEVLNESVSWVCKHSPGYTLKAQRRGSRPSPSSSQKGVWLHTAWVSSFKCSSRGSRGWLQSTPEPGGARGNSPPTHTHAHIHTLGLSLMIKPDQQHVSGSILYCTQLLRLLPEGWIPRLPGSDSQGILHSWAPRQTKKAVLNGHRNVALWLPCLPPPLSLLPPPFPMPIRLVGSGEQIKMPIFSQWTM